MDSGLSSEVGPLGRLFKDSVDLFWDLLQRISSLDDFDQQKKDDLRDEYGKFYFWGIGYHLEEGQLDNILLHSTRLRLQVGSLLSDIGEILCDKRKGLFWLADPNSSDAGLDAQRKEVESLIESFRGNSNDMPESLDDSDDSDDSSDIGEPRDRLEDVIRLLHIYIRCLVDLGPCLERPAPDASARILEAGPAAPPTIRGAANIWYRRIIDRFEGIDIGLAERLGEANRQRFQRVKQRLENASGGNTDGDDSDEGYCKCKEDAVPELPAFPKSNRGQDSLLHSSSTFQDSGLGTSTTAASIPASAYSSRNSPEMARADAASQVTYTSTLSEGSGERGWLRVPPLPEGATLGGNFRCTVCGDIVRNIKSQVDWKRHVFSDLEPYICTFQDCKGGISTYPTRKLWADHEFSRHHIKKYWDCRDCTITFDERDLFLQHINVNHGCSYTETIINAAERVVPKPTEDLACPFCPFHAAALKRRAFARHVGRHMEEIALGVLPRGTGSDDEGGPASPNQSHPEAEEAGTAGSSDKHQAGPPNPATTPQLLTNFAYEGPPVPTKPYRPKSNYTLDPLYTTWGELYPKHLFSPGYPIPKSANIPRPDKERRRRIESARARVLNSNNPVAQLEWAEDALEYVRVSFAHIGRVARLGPTYDDQEIRYHKISSDAIDIVLYLSRQHHPKAEYLEGLLFESGLPGQITDKISAYVCYQSAAKGGFARAEYRMGMQHENSHNIEKAIAHYQQGASLEDSASKYRMGMMFLLGQYGQERDFARGIQYIALSAKTADRDVPNGAYVYGMLLAGSLPDVVVPASVLPPDSAAAKVNIERAAYLGHAKAQVKMAQAYELCELGCDFHPLLSLHYNLLAARQGEAEAEMAMSRWFSSGHEGLFERDEELAFMYAERAALNGHPPAEFAIGYYHEVGVSVRVDADEARRWYKKAAEHGNRDAMAKLDGMSAGTEEE